MMHRRSELSHEPCCVCGMRDARALVVVVLGDGDRATLCGSHELMHRRAGSKAMDIAQLRAELGERRAMQRRATGEVDELAARLTEAFMSERRGSRRRSA